MKTLLAATLFSLLLSAATPAFAVNPVKNLKTVGDTAEYKTAEANPAALAASIIKVFLSLLGVVFLALLVYGGFTWMKAQGEEEEITRAKDTIKQAIIGLIIVLSAYAITFFVTSNLQSLTTAGR